MGRGWNLPACSLRPSCSEGRGGLKDGVSLTKRSPPYARPRSIRSGRVWFFGPAASLYRRFLVFSQPGQPAVRLNAEVVAEEGLVEGVVRLVEGVARREEALVVSPP